MYAKSIPVPTLDALIKYVSTWRETARCQPKNLNEREAFKQSIDLLYEKNKDTVSRMKILFIYLSIYYYYFLCAFIEKKYKLLFKSGYLKTS